MKLVFMGTPSFAVGPFLALIEAGHDIAAVVTRIDKPAGRGRALTVPPVKSAALERGIPVLQPRRVRDGEAIAALREFQADAIVVAAYGQILPPDILTMPTFGCINIHASLLPAYRGAAPVNWTIIRGETTTGVTIMQMDEGMDTGAILLKESIPIDPRDTAGTLTAKLSELGARLITETLPLIATAKIAPQPQDDALVSLAPMLKKENGRIDWTLAASEIRNRVRGLSPWPGAFTVLDGKNVKIIECEVAAGSGEPGRLYGETKNTLTVGTGAGLLRLAVVQTEGGKPMTAAEFLRGRRGLSGKRFDIGHPAEG